MMLRQLEVMKRDRLRVASDHLSIRPYFRGIVNFRTLLCSHCDLPDAIILLSVF